MPANDISKCWWPLGSAQLYFSVRNFFPAEVSSKKICKPGMGSERYISTGCTRDTRCPKQETSQLSTFLSSDISSDHLMWSLHQNVEVSFQMVSVLVCACAVRVLQESCGIYEKTNGPKDGEFCLCTTSSSREFGSVLWNTLDLISKRIQEKFIILLLLNKIIYCSFVWFYLVTSKTRSERIFCWFLTQIIERHWWFLHKLSRSTLRWVPRLTDWKHLPLVLDEIEAGVLWRGAKSAGS